MIDLSSKPTIEGTKVILRPFETGDLASIEECLNDPEVTKLTGSDPDPISKEVLYDWYTTRNEQKDRLDLGIIDKASSNLVGEAVINKYDELNHSMNFRILIGTGGRDRGLGSETTNLVVDYIFENTDLKQLTLNVFAFNPRAQRVYEKAGFVVTSVDKDELEFEGQMIDSYNMVLTRESWVENRKEL